MIVASAAQKLLHICHHWLISSSTESVRYASIVNSSRTAESTGSRAPCFIGCLCGSSGSAEVQTRRYRIIQASSLQTGCRVLHWYVVCWRSVYSVCVTLPRTPAGAEALTYLDRTSPSGIILATDILCNRSLTFLRQTPPEPEAALLDASAALDCSRASSKVNSVHIKNLHVCHWQVHDYTFGNIIAAVQRPKV